MKTVNFCFATHNHQPIGNFDYVIEEAYEKSYLPFFKLAQKYRFRFATHFSGILIDWIVRNHPEHIEILRALVKAGRLEIISGGFYEPILAVIPHADKLAQIRKLSSTIIETLRFEPQGMWLAERVWEQQLAASIHESGLRYTILDDTHFRSAGLEGSDLTGYYLTEDQGKNVAVFPISKELRYTIPFSSVDETLHILRDAATEKGENIITFADDGEKFGVWPKTYDHVYRNGWLKEFFVKLDENSSWLKTLHFSEALEHISPRGRIYLPNASYAEMMQWSLPSVNANLKYEAFARAINENQEESKEYGQFVHGGFWRNFFVKYPESNHLHKRMLRLSERFEAASSSVRIAPAFRKAYDHLLASQCNDPYWHGVFGGIYLANLRHEVYSHLIQAENELDLIESSDPISIECADINSDGVNDVIIKNKHLTIYVDPSRGGTISEIDFRSQAFNLSNFINRIPEASHEKLRSAEKIRDTGSVSRSIHDQVLTKEKGLEKRIVYDWYRHGSFIDHFLSGEATYRDLQKMSFLEHGDFFRSNISPSLDKSQSEVRVAFSHAGNVVVGGVSQNITLEKSLSIGIDSDTIDARISITNLSTDTLTLCYASEWTFGMLAGDADDRYYETPGVVLKNRKMNSSGEIQSATELCLVDEWTGFKISLYSEKPCTFWRTPIETVSLSEAGFERVYQGSIIFALWKIELQPSQQWDVKLAIRVKNTNASRLTLNSDPPQK